jgi:hypothetical protein
MLLTVLNAGYELTWQMLGLDGQMVAMQLPVSVPVESK